MKAPLCRILPIVLSARVILGADSTMDETLNCAWSPNAGWVNFRPGGSLATEGVVFGSRWLSGRAYAANFGWILFGSGAPTNGIGYQNNSASDYGVNHDGAGNLSGYAYSANAGWINFDWAGPVEANRPRVDLRTGLFSGYAYSANLGWIQLGGGLLKTLEMIAPDTDVDGISDAWEWERFGGLETAGRLTDFDEDGVLDATEYLADSNPTRADSLFRLAVASPGMDVSSLNVVFPSSPRRLYQLQVATALLPADWRDSGLGVFSPDDGETSNKTILVPSGSSLYLRSAALIPLQP